MHDYTKKMTTINRSLAWSCVSCIILHHIPLCFPCHFPVNIVAIIGGGVGGVVVAGVCFCIALCICVSICCCYRRKKAKSPTATGTTQETAEQQASAAAVSASQPAEQEGQQYTVPPGYNPDIVSSDYPTKAPLYPTPGDTLPTDYPHQQPYPAQSPDLPPPYPGTVPQ